MTEVLQQEIRTLKDIFESERDPEGRVFAPLADAFRRAGEIQQAVRLLNDGLARHPQFVPGHVVAAQLYVEQGLAAEAAIAARNALELDGENVNALRSLLAVLEESGDEEADDVRGRLMTLEPGFSPGEGESAPVAPPPLPEVDSAAPFVDVELEPPPVDADAETIEIGALGGGHEPPPLPATEAVGPTSLELDLVSEPELVGEEPVIDLDSLAPVSSEYGAGEAELADLPVELDVEPGDEEPIIDLDSLAPVDAAEEVEDGFAPPDPLWGAMVELPTEEPVIDLDQLGTLGAADSDAVVSLMDLAPDVEDEVGEEAVALEDLAPASDGAVMELDALAPQADEPVMELAALAPEADEPVMELAELAPEIDEPVMELAELAPEVDEPVMDLAALAPGADEPVMDLADLAPEAEVIEEVVGLEALAPDDEDEVTELADLAPDVDESVMDLADLAPEADEPVMDLTDLAPDEDEDVADPVMDLADLSPEPAVEVQADPAADDIIIDMDALKPSLAQADSDPVPVGDDGPDALAAPADSGTTDALDDAADDSVGEPVYTRTLGELYVKQGAIEQAIEVFRHLSGVDPADAGLARRLEELESGVPDPGAGERVGQDEEIEALARELAEGGHGEHEVESPFAWSDDGDGVEEGTEDGPTIGDYFDGLLTWKPGEKS